MTQTMPVRNDKSPFVLMSKDGKQVECSAPTAGAADALARFYKTVLAMDVTVRKCW